MRLNLSIKHILNIKYMLCINEILMILSVNARHSALKRHEIWEDRLVLLEYDFIFVCKLMGHPVLF